MEGFPILRLPSFALEEVLRNHTPIELLLLSQCSKRSSRIVPIAGTKNFFLSIEFPFSAVKLNRHFTLGDSYTEGVEFKLKLNNGDVVPVKYSVESKDIACEWDDLHDGLLQLAWHISEVFKCPIKELISDFNESSAVNVAIIKKLVGRQNMKIENLHLLPDFEEKDLKWISNNVKVTGKLTVNMDRKFKFNVGTWSNCDHLELSSNPDQRWITLSHFDSFKSCRKVHIDYMNLPYKGIDDAVKKWTTGFLPKLEELSISGRGVSNHKIMGFSKEELVRNMEDVEGKCIVRPGVEIEAQNGTKATISLFGSNDYYLFSLKVTKE